MNMNANELIGKHFFRDWKAESIIGSGSYGTVYRMSSNRLGEIAYAAMKWIGIPHQASDVEKNRSRGATEQQLRTYYTEQKDRLVREIQVMDKFHGHSNIIDMLNFETREREGGMGWDVFILMELLDSLENCLPSMTVRDIRRLGVNLCGALIACEQEHVIHRDIKPENIFRNKFGEYKLGDFGIARPMSGTASHLTVNQGTPLYMAPEVRLGKEYDHRADIYSLGLVFYRLLNQQCIPFLSPENSWSIEAEDEAYDRRLKGEALPVPAQLENRPGFAAVVLKSCAWRQEDRYANAREMLAALQAIPEQELADELLWTPSSGRNTQSVQGSTLGATTSSLHVTPHVEEVVPVPPEPVVQQTQAAFSGHNATVSVWQDQPSAQTQQTGNNATVSVWEDIHQAARQDPGRNATVSIWDTPGGNQQAGQSGTPAKTTEQQPKKEEPVRKEPSQSVVQKEQPSPKPEVKNEPVITRSPGSPKAFKIMSLVFVILSIADSEAAWFTINLRIGFYRSALERLFSDTLSGMPYTLFYGGLGLLSLWMLSKEKRKVSIGLAGVNAALSLIGMYGQWQYIPKIGLSWFPYVVASVLVLIYVVNQEKGQTFSRVCMVLGVVSLFLSLVLTFFEPVLVQHDLKAVGTRYWMDKDWFRYITSGGWFYLYRDKGPANVLMPFSRGILMIAFALGIRLEKR